MLNTTLFNRLTPSTQQQGSIGVGLLGNAVSILVIEMGTPFALFPFLMVLNGNDCSRMKVIYSNENVNSFKTFTSTFNLMCSLE